MRIIKSENPRPLNVLAVGPNGLVAAGSNAFGVTGDIEVWDATSSRLIMTVREPAGPATAVAFVPSGKLLLKSAGGFGVSVFDTTSWLGSGPDFDDWRMKNAEFALAACGNPMLVTEHASFLSGRVPFPARVSCWLLGEEFNSAYRCLWRHNAAHFSHYGKPVISPDGHRAAAVFHDTSTSHPRTSIQVWDANTGIAQMTIAMDPASPPQQLAFTADGSTLILRTDSNRVRLIDVVRPANAGELVNPGRPYVTGIAVHPRGPVACTRTNGTVTFWDAEKREQIRTLDWKAGKLVSVAFSPDGTLGAAGTEDGKVIVWDVDL
jgi:WD40 repeat protein